MSDVENRDNKERKLARELSRIFGDHYEEMMDILGDPPSLSNVPYTYWERYNQDVRNALSAQLNEIFYDQFMTALEGFGIGMDNTEGSEEALSFIQQYTFDLVKGITETTIEGIRKELEAWERDGSMRIEDLAKRLYRYYSPIRAEMIAITETTRAAAQGERNTVDKITAQSGIRFEAVWQTANDELVCPICGPRHNQVITDDMYPPAHPRCRCWVNHRVILEGENG